MVSDNDKKVWLWIAVAYLFSMAVRMIWVYWAHGHPEFYWNGELMLNTNDGYTWGAGAQKVLYGMHEHNPGIRDMWSNAIILLTVLATKLTPWSLDTVMLYMPAFVSSLVVIPVILIAKLYGNVRWGFFAALLGSIVWSYYNRTMVGYYDTDMFSATAPMFILYFLIKSTADFTLRSALYAALFIAVYPFLYDAGASIVYAMGILYGLYLIYYHRNDDTTYSSLILVFTALLPFHFVGAPWNYLLKLVLLVALYRILPRVKIARMQQYAIVAILTMAFLYVGNVFDMFYERIMQYIDRGTVDEAGLHFYSVFATIREAGNIPFEIFAKRIAGSMPGFFLAMIGYGWLLYRHRSFLLSLPLMGIGLFAWWGGLRFTVYAVPIAAMGAIFLFDTLASAISKKPRFVPFATGAMTLAMLIPNIAHILEYKVPTVMVSNEVKDLKKLDKVATDKDYTLTWWDYAYPIWYYSDTNTIIDGGKHQNDNYIVSKILQSDSPLFAANFARLAVETYVDSNYSIITDTLFKRYRDPETLMEMLAKKSYKAPKKTREIFFYFPTRMRAIYPTVTKFGNIDLKTGQPLRNIVFLTLMPVRQEGGKVLMDNGMVFDSGSGTVIAGRETLSLSRLVEAALLRNGKVHTREYPYRRYGRGYVMLFLKSFGLFVLMDERSYRSNYVQMGILGHYDKELFEEVAVSPYSRIYRLKR